MSETSPKPSATSFDTFGEYLKFLRQRARISQRELSIAVGYSESQISRLEGNLRPPDLPTLSARFAPALDIEDDPQLLALEWERKNVLPTLCDIYDDIWVYGLPQICNPLESIPLPASVRKKVVYTGYLHRELPTQGGISPLPEIARQPYLLATGGGGGDGEALIDWVLRAYEHDPLLPYPALCVLGPFMKPERQTEFMGRAARLKRVEVITFHSSLETLIAGAAGVVAMGGYNTFCEVISLNKRALLVPRTTPRLEQHIRASRAAALGLVGMLADDGRHDPVVMAAALRRLPEQKPPSAATLPGLLDGLPNIARLVAPWIPQARDSAPQALSSVA